MDSHTEPNGSWVAYKSAHPRLDWCNLCTESSVWTRQWEIIAYQALVQTAGRDRRLYADIAYKPMARGV